MELCFGSFDEIPCSQLVGKFSFRNLTIAIRLWPLGPSSFDLAQKELCLNGSLNGVGEMCGRNQNLNSSYDDLFGKVAITIM